MALWSICPVNNVNAVTEIQLWTKFKHQLVREETFNWAEFTVNADTKPEVDLKNENGYRVNHDPNYSWSLSQLMQTIPEPTVQWRYPETMNPEEVEKLKNLIGQGNYIALDTDGWDLSNTDFWLWGELNLAHLADDESFGE